MKTLKSSEAWFSFNGVSCLSHNVRMISPPSRPHPARKGRYEDVPGTDGGLWMDEGGYKNIPISVPCVAVDNLNIDDINAWLTGSGDLIFGDEPNRLYHARITGEFARNNLYGVMRGQEFTVSFDCEPYRYSANPEADKVGIDSDSGIAPSTWLDFNNPGTAEAYPLIKIAGTGLINIDLNIGGLRRARMTLYDLDPNTPVFIDCKAGFTYTGLEGQPYQLYTAKTSGDMLYLPIGESTLRVSADVDAFVVQPRWRWI